MWVQGFSFQVLSPIFAIHWGYQKKKTRPQWRERQNNRNRLRFKLFKDEIWARYGKTPPSPKPTKKKSWNKIIIVWKLPKTWKWLKLIFYFPSPFKDASKSAGISAISVHFKTIRRWYFGCLGFSWHLSGGKRSQIRTLMVSHFSTFTLRQTSFFGQLVWQSLRFLISGKFDGRRRTFLRLKFLGGVFSHFMFFMAAAFERPFNSLGFL